MASTKTHLLGIDIGTGSCKCLLMGGDGKVLAESSAEYQPDSPHPGWSEQDPETWYHAVRKSLGSLVSNSGITLDGVAAVGITGQMRGITLLSRDGKPVLKSILWNDNRCAAEAEEINRSHGELIRRLTFNPLNTMCSLPKVRWLINNEPGAWAKAAALLYPKDYVNYRLTGAMSTDHSDASGSSFYNLRRRDWSPEILERFGIGREKLPDILDSSSAIGRISESASRETGLPAGALVVAGGSDAVTELLAAGVTGETQCKLRLGTSGALSTAAADPGTGAGKYYVWSHAVPGAWMVDINTRSCAGSVQWLRDTFYSPLRDDPAGFDLIDQEAGTVTPGAEGLVFHPYLMGEDAPFWDPKLRASFWGIAARHGRAHFARAVYEGTAFALRHARDALGEIAEKFTEYLLVGGGAKSPVWRSIVLDVLGVDARLPGEAASAKGAAMLAGMGAGIFGGPEEARKRCVSVTGTLKFNPRNHQQYSALFARYRAMKEAFDGIYER